ncbi:VAN3-binding protein isoform X2 [Momordica charantia]|uniref:VAN3-binding protein isoform X2 n=1 Tax=Momordica charantia TaxID=3673 RepID=A0A6J1BYK9_MOMCH|nr:VAN3-binding protein isoform X2 [Momordica charantia]
MEGKWNLSSSPSAAHPETMDVLSQAWCNFAVQTIHPELQDHKPLVLLDSHTPVKELDPFPRLEKTVKMEAEDHVKPIPPWKSNDMKSFIWMQQAMHPELNYSGYFRKKWFDWKIVPFKNFSIKKWIKEIRQKRKDEERVQRAEIHAAISVAGVAAALAAIAAADTSPSKDHDNSGACGRDAAVASAAALVAAQCAQVAQAMGAKREQLTTVIASAMATATATDILTLTAAAATSLKGAATLKARSEYKNRSTGVSSVLPIEDNHEIDFNLEKSKSTLAKGLILKLESPNGKYKKRSISIIQNSDTKVILKVRKLNMLKTKQESVVLDMYIELYKDENEEEDDNDDEDIHTCYLIVLTTNKGTFKLDMADDYHKYKIWVTAINQMLLLSAHSFTRL